VDLLVSFGFYLLERDAAGTEIRSYADALFWTSSQITTVSSSLTNPITAGGRWLAVVTDFVAVATVSLLFGTIAQHIHVVSPKARTALPRRGRRGRRRDLKRGQAARSDLAAGHSTRPRGMNSHAMTPALAHRAAATI